jgi:hypothetical protein
MKSIKEKKYSAHSNGLIENYSILSNKFQKLCYISVACAIESRIKLYKARYFELQNTHWREYEIFSYTSI